MENKGFTGSVDELPRPRDDVQCQNDSLDFKCGLGGCTPRWMQKFATRRMYVFVYSVVGLVQSMYFAYFVAVSTTIEKQFKLRSQITGVILIANEISEIILSLVLSYFGNKSDRPKLVAAGMLCTTFSCFLAVIPHFSYSSDLLPAINSNNGTGRIGTDPSLCAADSFRSEVGCSGLEQSSALPILLLFFSKFTSGIGTTLFYTLGFAYMDDNAKETQTPVLIGFVSSLRLLGPTTAYIMASGLLKLYVNVNEVPPFKPSDPQWIGAWWIGFIIIGTILPILAFVLALFPKILPTLPKSGVAPKEEIVETAEDALNLDNFITTLKRMFSNKILMVNNAGAVFRTFAFSGYISFLPKFLEQQFQQTASTASLVNGALTVISMASGFMLSGFVISRWRPRAFLLQIWSVVLGILFFGCFIGFAFMKCNRRPMFGEAMLDGTIDVLNPCNNVCGCESTKFTPVCSNDGLMNFYSACHAGCQNVTTGLDNKKMYSDCICISQPKQNFETVFPAANPLRAAAYQTDSESTSDSSHLISNGYGFVTEGYCVNDCHSLFLIYITASALLKFLSSTSFIGNILINFRCVKKEDKSIALGMGNFLTSLFGFIPGPIIFGALIDKACILWRRDCAKLGNCWMYDPDRFQMTLHLLTGCFFFLGTICEAILCWYIKDLDLYGEKEKNIKEEGTEQARSAN